MSKVLVVDDEEFLRTMINDFLSMLDYEVIEAENGVEAFEKTLNENPDIIVSDINMPNMGGIELLKKVKKLEKRIPVILITGVSIEKAREEAEKYYADGFFSKPFKMQTLIGRIEELLDN
jgi:two-component system response regulator ResD